MHHHVCGGTGSRTIPSQITRNVSRTFLVVADQPRHLGLHRCIKGVTSLHQLLIQYPNLHLTGAILSGSRSEEHTSELQSLMRRSYAVFCLKKKIIVTNNVNL